MGSKMSCQASGVDAVVIGGGFYGAAIAIYLAKQRGLKHIMLVERESELLSRASRNNQARVHNGYHYPRSFTTAYRSRVNAPRFINDLPSAITQDFTNLYAIARHNSSVTPKQFVRFCKQIGARIEPSDQSLRYLFEPRLIEDVFLVEECVFDYRKLASWAKSELFACGVDVRLDTRAIAIHGSKKNLMIILRDKQGDHVEVKARYVFNCTYSGLNQFKGDFNGTHTKLKQEITEMPLVHLPPELTGLGITVMDGPFFSIMPFPARGLHTLSHVRYTPHMNWQDEMGIDPYQRLNDYGRPTRVDRMVRDAGRYIPKLLGAKYIDSLFEVKTLLVKNERDDGRPILYEEDETLPGCYSVLGGKIDNIYDVLEKLDSEHFS
jgi:glycine/D-amino acid oxidase-like deaminating enzyme